MGKELRLNEFKDLYKAWKKGIPWWLASSPWWDHLLLAGLYWVEEHYINLKTRNAVDKVIKEVVLPPMPDCVTPIYRETPSVTSTSLPEVRLTAPWYDGGVKGAEPATDASRDL